MFTTLEYHSPSSGAWITPAGTICVDGDFGERLCFFITQRLGSLNVSEVVFLTDLIFKPVLANGSWSEDLVFGGMVIKGILEQCSRENA